MSRDNATLSNYHQLRTTHTHLDWSIDWPRQLISGTATLTLKPAGKGAVNEVVLDTSFLDIRAVTVDAADVKWTKAERIEAMGEALTIRLEEPKLDAFKVEIEYSTTKECTALGWLTKEQTKGGQHPYLYSQSQAIHARSLLPCQDTPSIKATYSATVKSTLPVLLSALRQSPAVEAHHGGKQVGVDVVEYVYDQPVPIPSYLIAIASGNLVYKAFPPIEGKKWTAGVWTEPEGIDDAYWEFSADIGRYISIAEELTTPYEWGVYDTLVLPPSFPYGGMENTCLTFVTPVLIAHDRSLTDVCAHEIAHSWTGNLIGCASWNHFWLNEGWTTYLERMILNDMHGPAERDLSYIIGRKMLRDALKEMPARYQKLVIDYERYADPDDGFSTVPYDKGSNFLLHIERQLGGLDVFRPYIKAYIEKFSGNVVTTEEWRAHLYDFFKSQEKGDEYVKRLDEIKWDEWLHGSGDDLPVDMKYDETLAEQCYDLANRWVAASKKDDYAEFSPKDLQNFTSSQKIVFLERLQAEKTLPVSTLKALDKVYRLDTSTNGEIRLRWYGLTLPAGTEYAESAAAWVVDQGRMKMCRTVYRLLYAVAPKLAQDTFKAHAAFYHPIARKMIAKDLKLE
ncbi:Leucyl aminopeptidase yscIV [Naganishia albida]|nr:Leucyl aminopeptidase yscIV [Naganishia albida]